MKNGVEDFVVESTPVLDLKKQSLTLGSTSSVSSSSVSERAWDADRTEVYADADGESAVAALMGEQGEIYPITTFPFVMGRGAECDLVLQGKGVSRRHAEIIFQAGRFVVNDLESLNGIKVNGYKVSRVILEEGDSIKLGEVTLAFRSKDGAASAEGGGEAKSKPKAGGLFARKNGKVAGNDAVVDDTFGPSPLKKLAVNSALLVVAVLLSLVGYQFWKSQMHGGTVIVEAPSSSQPSVGQNETAASQAGRVDVSAAGVAREPVVPAVKSQEQPEAAVAAAVTDVAPDAVVVEDAGVAPPPSLAPPPSIAPAVVESKPPEPARVATAPSKPAPTKASAPVIKTPTTKSAAPPRTDQVRLALASAQDLYLGGNAPKAISMLKPLLDERGVAGDVRSQVQDAYSKYTALFEQYSAGQSSYLKGEKERAFEVWVDFMDKEALAFNGKKSTYTRNISSRVVSEYVSLGTEASRNGEHHKAYRLWKKALEIEDNVAARIAIDNANNRAMQLYRQALRLEYVNTSKAKALWMEVTELLPPGTEYNTKASAKLAWYDKWGA